MAKCPRCSENIALDDLILHFVDKHVIYTRNKKRAWIIIVGLALCFLLFSVLSLAANAIQVQQFLSGDSPTLKNIDERTKNDSGLLKNISNATENLDKKLNNIEKALLVCSLRGDLDNATSCLSSKGITLRDIQEYLETHKNDLNKKYITGLGYAFKGDYDLAIVYINLSLEDNPFNYQAYNILTQLYVQKYDYNKTIEYGLKCLEYNSFDVLCQRDLADAYAYNERYNESIEVYEPLLPTFEDGYRRLLNNLGTSYANEGQCNKSLQMYQRVAPLSNNPCVYFNLGKAYAQVGMRNEALQAYGYADAIDPDYFSKCFPDRKYKILLLNVTNCTTGCIGECWTPVNITSEEMMKQGCPLDKCK